MEIEKAFKRLLIKDPFYGLFSLGLSKEVSTKTQTLAVVKEELGCKLLINPDFWQTLTDDQQIAVLKHELGHICFQHMFLVDSFPDNRLFNISADMEINSYIENLPPNGCRASDIGLSDGLGTKVYYEKLTERQQSQQGNPQKPCNGGKGGSSNDGKKEDGEKKEDSQSDSSPSPASEEQDTQQEQDTRQKPERESEKEEEQQEDNLKAQYPEDIPDGKSPTGDHGGWKEFQNTSEAVRQLMTNNINSMLKTTAEQVAKQRGTIPANLRELIEKLNEKKPEVFNWKAYFRRLLGSIYDVNIRSTRRKQSKRFEGSSGIQHKKKVSILVAVDTSGSVSTKELQEFFNEIDYIFRAGARITILECDARINSVTEYDGKNIPEIKGRGGTDFNPPVDYYVKHKKDYASLVYFTDGECVLPQKKPSGIVWVITSDGYHQNYPGKTIYIPKQQQT